MPAGGARKGTKPIVPSNGRKENAAVETRRQSIANFREYLADGGLRPSILLLKLMRGDAIEHVNGDKTETLRASFADRVDIARHLVQYELPRLASIEADITTGEKSHEDWVRELAEEGHAEEHTIQ